MNFGRNGIAAAALAICAVAQSLGATPSPTALAMFDAYAGKVESRLAVQHGSVEGFAGAPQPDENGLRLEHVGSTARDGAMLHHWRGAAFVPGARAADFERLLRDVPAYPRIFAPEVLDARTLSQDGDRLETRLRVRQHHVITVVMDTAYTVEFGRFDAERGYSRSRSTRIEEIGGEHGFLWRLNTYWTYAERDGGLDLQIETISLTRSIPPGLGWVIGSYVNTIPRESLEFTLHKVCEALRHSERD